jgi:hypothetical protein
MSSNEKFKKESNFGEELAFSHISLFENTISVIPFCAQ